MTPIGRLYFGAMLVCAYVASYIAVCEGFTTKVWDKTARDFVERVDFSPLAHVGAFVGFAFLGLTIFFLGHLIAMEEASKK